MELLCAKQPKRAVSELKELNEDADAGTLAAFVADLSFEDRIALERAQEREDEGVGAMEADEDEYAGLGDVLDIMDDQSGNESGNESDAQSGGAPRKNAASVKTTQSEAAKEDEDEEDGEGADEDADEDQPYAPQSLKNPNPFEHKLQKSEPILFLSKNRGITTHIPPTASPTSSDNRSC